MTEKDAKKIVRPQLDELAVSRQASSDLARLLSSNRWAQLCEIALVFSPVLMVILALRMMGSTNPMLFLGAIWVGNVAMLGLIWLGIKLRGETWVSIGLSCERPISLSKVGWAVLQSIPILMFAVSGFIVGSIVMANIVGIPEDADMTQYNYLSGNLPMLLVSLAGVYFVSSFGEEVVYRGFLITRLQHLFGGQSRIALVAALIFSSIIFGFAHFGWGPMGIAQTTCMGGALGISFLMTKRRLWPLILAHGIMDTMLLVPLYLAPETAG